MDTSIPFGGKFRTKTLKTLPLRIFSGIEYWIRVHPFLNSARNETQYRQLIVEPMSEYKVVHFVIYLQEWSPRIVPIMSRSLSSFLSILKELDFEENTKKLIFIRLINTTIQSTCYILCCRDKVMTTIARVVFT